MAWIDGLLGLVSGGIVSAGISLYNAKSNKKKIDIGNMQEMLNEAHKMYDEAAKRYDDKVKEFDDYKRQNMQYITEFKGRFAMVEERLDQAENSVLKLKSAVYQGYRCRYPENIEDCPVIKEYEKIHCSECDKKE